MVKLVSLIISGILGAALAGVGAVGVVSSTTSAPKHNPASSQIVDYGNR